MATRDLPRLPLGPGDAPLPLGYPDWDGRWPEAVVAWHMGIAREEPRRYVPERTCRVVGPSELGRLGFCGIGYVPGCSVCGYRATGGMWETWDYCPRCGARVEGER